MLGFMMKNGVAGFSCRFDVKLDKKGGLWYSYNRLLFKYANFAK